MAKNPDDAIRAPILSTPRADVLLAKAEGDRLFGLGGPDRLSSDYNRTWLYGGFGNDRLTTEVAVTGPVAVPGGAVVHQDGGDGHDRLSATASATGTEGDVNATNYLTGGDGDDEITGSSVTAPSAGREARNVVYGGAGDDAVNVFANGYTAGRNLVDGGVGDDILEASARSIIGFVENVMHGEQGADTIDADAEGARARNTLTGGAENDDLSALATAQGVFAESAFNEVRGGYGNDVLRSQTSHLNGGFRVTADNNVYGGRGDDTLFAYHSDNGSARLIEARNLLDGGAGADNLEAVIFVSGASDAVGVNTLYGRGGGDQMTAFVEAIALSPGETPFGVNDLYGGDGADDMRATVLRDSAGQSRLFGGAGDDALTVTGGSGAFEAGSENILDGGLGSDVLLAGAGVDSMRGGAGGDFFQFVPEEDQGTDMLSDFDRAEDSLVFVNVDDRGPVGNADDLDAISSITDAGVGLDVTVVFDSGTVLVFSGVGTGAVASFADLVDDPLTQILG